jgi:hypothetical protein
MEANLNSCTSRIRRNWFALFILLSNVFIFNSCEKNNENEPDIYESGITGITTNQGVVINGVTWATCNVAAKGNFVASPEGYGNY